MRVAVALSGGMDSLFALLSLQEQGHEVIGLHAQFLPGGPAASLLQASCARLHIPLHISDQTTAFEAQVIAPFIAEYAAARTPNPCALCNRTMKFGALLDVAESLGASALATGHYVGLVTHPIYGPCLQAGADTTKDQSYFLSLTPPARLQRCLFPLSHSHKNDIRAWLSARHIPVPLPTESQEICFIPNDDYRAFLQQRRLPELPGPMLLNNTPISTHKGLWHYTEGQRKGLGLAHSEPLYVLAKNPATNSLILAPRAQLYITECRATQLNLLVDPALWPSHILVRTRYRQKTTPAQIELTPDAVHCQFNTPQAPCAPGQILALYDAQGYVLAGAVLE